MEKLETTYYLHGSKDDTYELREQFEEHFDLPAPRELSYIGYEVKFDIEIDESGTAHVTEINGVDVRGKGIKL